MRIFFFLYELENEEANGYQKDTGVRFLKGRNPRQLCRNVDVLRS